MAAAQIPGPSFLITPATANELAGSPARLGNTGNPNVAFGGFAIDVVPDANFQGSVAVLGRSEIKDASDDEVSFMAWPVRYFYLNGDTPDSFALQSDVIVTGRSYLVVPAPGAEIALLIACSAGSAKVYWQQITGNTIP